MPFLSDLAGTVYEELARRMTSTQPPGLTTGLPAVDEMVGGGWVRQQLSYLVGDSGVGKSWLASSWMLRGVQWLVEHPNERPMTGYVLPEGASAVQRAVLDKENKTPIIVFWSLEMAESPVITRFMAQLGKDIYGIALESGKLLRGNIGATPGTPEWDETIVKMRGIYQLLAGQYGKHVYMEFQANTVSQFRQVLDELTAAYDIVFVVVDYFRLIDDIAYDGSMSTLQATKSNKLKEVARDYDCHVLSLFDITRSGQLSSNIDVNQMKGGTAAQYDADLVLTLAENKEDKQAARTQQSPYKHLVLRVGKGRHVANSYIELRMEMSTGYVELWDQKEGMIHEWGA